MENVSTDVHPILIYDGDCGLCNRAVDYILKHDVQGQFRFVANGSTIGKSILKQYGLATDPPPQTMVVIANNKHFTKSEAALMIARILGGRHKIMGICWLVPGFLRNVVYDLIARNRYRWFGKKTTCRLPKPGESERFLD